SQGTIAIAGTIMSDAHTFVQPEKRPVGMIFQGLALFPHMTVAENVGFGLAHLGRSERRERVQEELGMVGLQGMEARYPHQLSGGQQQRVAIARSLVRRPALMLMDEPFSDLDPDTRQQVRSEVKRILGDHGITSIIVTHDPQDADQVADRVLAMQAGALTEANGPAPKRQ
ncbi:MAG: ATP-binding cassette domain-containing protein, partial [Flavobacteriales bacterium]|nr:ATP-binding cassette domain-containing protein [Flavobacteriales bacterium]